MKQQKANAWQTNPEQPGQVCSNSIAEIKAWLRGGKRHTESLITEECRAEAAPPAGTPEMPPPRQPAE